MQNMRCFGKVLSLLLVIVLLSTPGNAAAQEVDPSVANGCNTLDAAYPLLGEEVFPNTEAAILYEVNTDTLLFAYNPDEKLSPSSLTKLVTAIVAIEQGELSDVVTAQEHTLEAIPGGAVSVGIQPGEELTLLDLLYCMLVGSGNDASAVIAAHFDQTEAQFAARMNAFVESIGCTSTNFTNPHGLHDSAQYTSARDVAKILSYATKNETFSKLIGTKNYSVPATNIRGERHLTTGNHLMSKTSMSLYYDSRVTGGRTGITNDNKRCMAATAEHGSLKLISVVLGCRDSFGPGGSVSHFGSYPETINLLDMGFKNLRSVQIFYPGQVLKQYPLPNGDANLFIGVQTSNKSVLPMGVGSDDLRYVFEETGILNAPVEKDSTFGRVQVYYGSNCVASAQLYALNQVGIIANNRIDERHEDSTSSSSPWPILAVVAAVFVTFLLLLRYSKKFRRIVGSKKRRRR